VAVGVIGCGQSNSEVGIFTTAKQIGGALGLAFLSTLASNRSGSPLADGTGQAEAIVSGYQVAFAVGAAMLAAGALLIMFVLRSRDLAAVATAEPVAATA
jgi:hypothetical protein